MNTDLILAVADHIEAEPSLFMMDSWYVASHGAPPARCNTAACIGGTAVILDVVRKGGTWAKGCATLDHHLGGDDGSGALDMEAAASAALGLPVDGRGWLFYTSFWPVEYRGRLIAESGEAEAAVRLLRDLAAGEVVLLGTPSDVAGWWKDRNAEARAALAAQ